MEDVQETDADYLFSVLDKNYNIPASSTTLVKGICTTIATLYNVTRTEIMDRSKIANENMELVARDMRSVGKRLDILESLQPLLDTIERLTVVERELYKSRDTSVLLDQRVRYIGDRLILMERKNRKLRKRLNKLCHTDQ